MPCLRPRGAMDLNRHRVGFVPGPGAQIVHYSGPFGTFGYPACRYGGPMPIYALGDKTPRIHPDSFIHPDAVIIGDVTMGSESSVWPCAVLRGDVASITVGQQTSIQDGSVIHVSTDVPTIIGNRCTIGHNAHLEGCTVFDDCLIGSGAVVLHHVMVGPHALIGASAMVPNNKVIPEYAKAMGVPVRIIENALVDVDFNRGVDTYVANVHLYSGHLRRLD